MGVNGQSGEHPQDTFCSHAVLDRSARVPAQSVPPYRPTPDPLFGVLNSTGTPCPIAHAGSSFPPSALHRPLLGGLSSFSAPQLGALVIKEALVRAKLDAPRLDE